ncbi:MAG: VPLPA-CTERM sorting domain-containing protein [Pseudomonadota bacterium]
MRYFGALSVIGTLVFATPALAVTVGFTEGARNTVAETTRISPSDTSSEASEAFDLLVSGGTALGVALDEGETITIFGRIVNAVDNFAFTSATTAFSISLNFDGYTFFNSGTSGATTNSTLSGLTADPAGAADVDKSVVFRLLDASDGFAEIASVTRTSDTTSGVPLLFSAGAGSYVLQVDGSADRQRDPALYDISVTGLDGPTPAVVPLPAPAILLITALGGLGAAARYRRRIS